MYNFILYERSHFNFLFRASNMLGWPCVVDVNDCASKCIWMKNLSHKRGHNELMTHT